MADNNNSRLPAGATLVSGDLPPAASASAPASGGLPPGATLVSGTVPSITDTTPAPGTTGVGRFVNQIGEGGAEAAGDIYGAATKTGQDLLSGQAAVNAAKTVWNSLPPVQLADSVKQILPMLDTFHKARESGASISDSIAAVNEAAKQHTQNISSLKPIVDAYRANPTRETARALTDATALAASIFLPGAVEGALPEEAEAVESPSWLQKMNPFRAKAALTSSPVSAVSPIEAKVAQVAEQSGLPAGTPETTVPTGANIQPDLHQGVRNFVNATHADAGLPPVPNTTNVLDVAQNSADAFQARSQGTFKQVEAITKVNPTTLRDIMSARADQIENFLAAGKDEEAGNLQQLQLNDENRMAKAFADAKAKGVDVEQARSDWNKSLRADELSSAVRSSKSATSTIAKPDIDPSKLTPKLQKLYESQPGGKTAKLTQLGGDTNARTFVESAENARSAAQAIKEFEPVSATGQKAMQDILRPNTGSRVIGSGTKTNFLKSLSDFEKLSPEDQAARFPGTGEVEQARSFLKSQARWQVGKRIATGLSLAAIASALGVTGAVIHALME